jgi:hypothetical protein
VIVVVVTVIVQFPLLLVGGVFLGLRRSSFLLRVIHLRHDR